MDEDLVFVAFKGLSGAQGALCNFPSSVVPRWQAETALALDFHPSRCGAQMAVFR